MMTRASFAWARLLLGALVGMGCSSATYDDSQAAPPENRALEILKRQLQGSERLEDLDIRVIPGRGYLVLTGTARTDSSARVLIADSNGIPLTPELVEAIEWSSRDSAHKKLTERAIALASSTKDHVEVVIAFRADTMPIAPSEAWGASIEEFSSHLAASRRLHREQVARTCDPLKRRLEAAGATLDDCGLLPFISGTVPASLLTESLIVEDPNIVAVDGHEDEPVLRAYASHGALGEGGFTGGSCGGYCAGGLWGVAIWESSPSGTNGTLALANQRFFYSTLFGTAFAPQTCSIDSNCLPYPGAQNHGVFCQGGTCRSEHASIVLSAVGMFGSYLQDGVTFPQAGAMVRPWHANYSNYRGIEWATDSANVVYVNRSAGTSNGIGPTDQTARAIDYAVRRELVTITIASGNDAEIGKVADCQSWNGICVGSYHRGSWSTTSDDTISVFSSYLNDTRWGNPPPERPHVVAPGEGLSVANTCLSSNAMTSSWCSPNYVDPNWISGTSFAAPMVLGEAVLMREYAGILSYFNFPLVNKAVLIVAGADANQDGLDPVVGVDAKDGAGAPKMGRIKTIIDGSRLAYSSVTPAQLAGGARVLVGSVAVAGHHKLRVTLVWNSCATSGLTGTNALNDLDLYVTRPSACGGSIVSSTRVNSEWELLTDDCLANQTSSGTYSIRVGLKGGTSLQLCSPETDEPIAVAWDIL